MDGLPRLEKVFQEEFPHAKTQRCQVHVAKNVLAKVQRKQEKTMADDLRSVFYASTKEKTLQFYDIFQKAWQTECPSAAKCLEKFNRFVPNFFLAPSGREDTSQDNKYH